MSEPTGPTIEDYLLEDRTFPPPEAFKKDALVASARSCTTRPTRTGRASGPGRPASSSTGTRTGTRSASGSCPFAKWFVGGKLNVSDNCLDRHVAAGRGDQVAYHWEGEPGDTRTITYADLLDEVAALRQRAEGPRRAARATGSRIYMPMIPELPVAHAGLRPHRRAALGRLRRLLPRLARRPDQRRRVQGPHHRRRRLAARCSRAPLKPTRRRRARGARPPIEHVVVVQRTARRSRRRHAMTEGRDHWYHDLMADADAECPPEPMDSEDLLYLLYTSGTTAKPKGIMHTTGGYLTQVAFTHKYVFDLHPDTDVYWCAADIGWVTGHSYIVYGPLANGATSRDVRGHARHARQATAGGTIVEKYGVTILYTAPTAIRTFMKWGDARARASTTCRRCGCSARSASRSTPRRGCGTSSTSAAAAARSSTRGGRPRPAPS